MKDVEKIPVYIDTRDGRTVCVCHAGRKGCGKKTCVRDTVTRDKYNGWRQTMERNKYGQ